jgi:cytochrome c-type biogenesis protein CcmH/NrfG
MPLEGHPWQLPLRPAWRALFFVAVALVASLLVTLFSVRAFVAARNTGLPDQGAASLERLERAVWVEPYNAENWYHLGMFRLFVHADVQRAIADLEEAARLNPHRSRHWLGLATACLVAGDLPKRQRALQKAVASDPSNTEIAWEAANSYIAQQETEQALPLLRTVAEKDEKLRATALQMAWRVTNDVQRMLDSVVPPEPAALLAFVRLLTERDQPQAAAAAWERLVALGQPVPVREAGFYIDYLLKRQEADGARREWERLWKLQGEDVSRALLFNGSFETEPLNTGFDWRHWRQPGLTLAIDSLTAYAGRNSFSWNWDGTPIDGSVIQYVAVAPEKRYVFRGYVKTSPFEGANGPRVAVYDVRSGERLEWSEDLRGSETWRPFEFSFRTPATTRLVAVRVVRPAGTMLRGRLWLDDLALEPRTASGGD